MEPYSIFIPVAPKDNNKIKYLLRSIEEHLTGYTDIHFSVPDLSAFDPLKSLYPHQSRVYAHEDRAILDIDPTIFRYRPGWIFQQLMKLFQRVTQQDLFLTVDSDVIINRHMPMFRNGRRIWYLGLEQYHEPYFVFSQRMFGFGRVYPHTFINDMNFMDRTIVMEMATRHCKDVMDFIRKSAAITDGNCYMAEPELYGNYVTKYHPGMYFPVQAASTVQGRWSDNPNSVLWPDADIEQEIAKMRSAPYDLFMLHSWCNNNIYHWAK